MINQIDENLFYAGKRHKIVCAGDCYHVKNIKPKNRLIYNSLEEAIADGCRLCKHCQGQHKVEKVKEAKHIAIQNLEPNIVDANWDGTKSITFGLMGDTQFGSKYAQITYLHKFYDICAKEGVTDVYHTGDITDGLKMRPGHEYELYTISADER